MLAIYIISNKQQAKGNKYKVGCSSDSKDRILSRYAKYLDDPKIYYFSKLENRGISKAINTAIKKYKIKSADMPFSFVSININKLIECIENVFELHKEKQHSHASATHIDDLCIDFDDSDSIMNALANLDMGDNPIAKKKQPKSSNAPCNDDEFDIEALMDLNYNPNTSTSTSIAKKEKSKSSNAPCIDDEFDTEALMDLNYNPSIAKKKKPKSSNAPCIDDEFNIDELMDMDMDIAKEQPKSSKEKAEIPTKPIYHETKSRVQKSNKMSEAELLLLQNMVRFHGMHMIGKKLQKINKSNETLSQLLQ